MKRSLGRHPGKAMMVLQTVIALLLVEHVASQTTSQNPNGGASVPPPVVASTASAITTTTTTPTVAAPTNTPPLISITTTTTTTTTAVAATTVGPSATPTTAPATMSSSATPQQLSSTAAASTSIPTPSTTIGAVARTDEWLGVTAEGFRRSDGVFFLNVILLAPDLAAKIPACVITIRFQGSPAIVEAKIPLPPWLKPATASGNSGGKQIPELASLSSVRLHLPFRAGSPAKMNELLLVDIVYISSSSSPTEPRRFAVNASTLLVPEDLAPSWDGVGFFLTDDRESLEPRDANDIVDSVNSSPPSTNSTPKDLATLEPSIFVDVSSISKPTTRLVDSSTATGSAQPLWKWEGVDDSLFDRSRHLAATCEVVPNTTVSCLGCAAAKLISRLTQRMGFSFPSQDEIRSYTETYTATQRHTNSGDPTSLEWLRQQATSVRLRRPDWQMTGSVMFVSPYGALSARKACARIARLLACGCSVAVSSWGRHVLPVLAVASADLASNSSGQSAFCALVVDDASGSVGPGVTLWDVERNVIYFPRTSEGQRVAFLFSVCTSRVNCRHHDFCTTQTNSSGSFSFCRTKWACLGGGYGDPNYVLNNGTLQVCDGLGKHLLIASSSATVMVEHAAVGATTATAIVSASITFHSTGRTVFFSAKDSSAPADTSSEDGVLVSVDGAADVALENVLRVERVKTTFGAFLNVQAVVALPTSGILVNGCPSPTLINETQFPMLPECADIQPDVFRRACNIDAGRIGSSEFVHMSRRGASLMLEVQPSTAAAAEKPARVQQILPPTATTPTIILAAATVGAVATATFVAVVGYIVFRRYCRPKNYKDVEEDPAATNGKATVYVVGSPAASEVAIPASS